MSLKALVSLTSVLTTKNLNLKNGQIFTILCKGGFTYVIVWLLAGSNDSCKKKVNFLIFLS